jgi:pilus assembly protein CpaF
MPAEASTRGSGLPERMKASVRSQLSQTVDSSVLDPLSNEPDREAILRAAIRQAVDSRTAVPVAEEIVDLLYDELVGLGPLQPLMEDPQITDVLVNRFDEIFVERKGVLHRVPNRFKDQAQLEHVIQKIVALVGREINLDKPLVDARMADGSRANAVFAPVGGPTLCIRKFNRVRLALLPSDSTTVPNWVDAGGLSLQMAAYLEALAAARANILIAGATGSGKSTLLRAIVSAFPPEERVITIEDTAELELENPHWVKLECVHSKDLGGRTTQERRLDVSDLVQNALRMRPDRLIIGEIRHSREAYYALEALNTGHDGSATTIHASSCVDALARLELLISRDFGQLSPAEIRRYLARVFDLVIFIARLRDGRRCVLEIAELDDVDADGRYRLKTAFQARVSSSRGRLAVEFLAMPGYEPGERIRRKLDLEGMRWIA